MNFLSKINPFKVDEAEIIRNKRNNVIYVANFPKGEGKYITIADSVDYDIDIKISPKIQLRITYITEKNKITGVEIAKVETSGKLYKINFSTLEFERILQLLKVFTDLDLKLITNRSLLLDQSIIDKPQELERFLKLIAIDPQGQEKMLEIINNFKFIQKGDINDIAQKKKSISLFKNILNNKTAFNDFKSKLGVKKDEEVWQKFFSQFMWILGSDYIEILDERVIDPENIVDYLMKSYDGYVDIIELKLPTAPFWTDNFVPRSELTSSIMQCMRYLLEIERRINDNKFIENVNNTPIAKPRITLIYGRSYNWQRGAKEAYRILNSGFQNLTILTYDHVLQRAERIVGILNNLNKKIDN